jgi:hypothetical protein
MFFFHTTTSFTMVLCVWNVAVSLINLDKKQNSLFTGLEWPRGFQEVKVPRFHDNGAGWW